MSDYDLIYAAIEDFLVKERGKLSDERSFLDTVLNILQDDSNQQLQDSKHIDQNWKQDKSIQLDLETDNCSKESRIVNCVKNEATIFGAAKKTELPEDQTCSTEDFKKLKHYNSQLEKERLAYLFENAPYFLCLNRNSRKYRSREYTPSYKSPKKWSSKSEENKENDTPASLSYDQKIQFLTSNVKDTCQNGNVRNMVRYGEFSPLNPDLRLSTRPLIGLGEYEERRKLFLEKKKREYQQYLASVKNRKDLISRQKKKNSFILSVQNGNSSPPSPPSPLSRPSSSNCRELFTPDQGIIDGSDSSRTKYQQEMYRKELDKQINEKKKLKKEEEILEKENCINCESSSMAQRKSTMKHIEDEFHRKIDLLNGHENQKENLLITTEQSNVSPKVATAGNSHEYNRDLQNYRLGDRMPSFVRTPTMKPNAESCAIDDIEALERMKQELYKKELNRQIEEKRRLENIRKAKEKEEEKKLEEKVKREEEKLRQDYEREQAELAYRASQRVQIQERVLENLRRIERENDIVKIKSMPKEFSKPINTTHIDRGSTKNVSFAPQASVYSIRGEITHRVREKAPYYNDDSVIIEAPYTLAVKDNSVCCNAAKPTHSYKQAGEPTRSSSPILPALKTQHLLKSLSNSNKPYIPSSVSMSEYAREKYLRSNKIFSSFAQIRKQLMEQQRNLQSE